jgi:thioredoxin-like negative regulator of GroEL
MQQGDAALAFDLYSRALALKPENLISLFGLVQSAHVLSRTADVVEPLQRYLDVNPDKSEVRYALAGCLVACGRSEDARAALEELLARDSA